MYMCNMSIDSPHGQRVFVGGLRVFADIAKTNIDSKNRYSIKLTAGMHFIPEVGNDTNKVHKLWRNDSKQKILKGINHNLSNSIVSSSQEEYASWGNLVILFGVR